MTQQNIIVCYTDSYIKTLTNPWDSNESALFIKMMLLAIKFTRNRAVDAPGVRPYVCHQQS